MNIVGFFKSHLDNFLQRCTKCGLCIEQCAAIPHTGLKEMEPRAVQEEVAGFFTNEMPSETVYERAFSCIECYKCKDICPENLNPMYTCETIKWLYSINNIQPSAAPALDFKTARKAAAGIQLTTGDYHRLTSLPAVTKSKNVFFPGCNAYFQPEKILLAMDVMERLDIDFAFLPGVDYCCGNAELATGGLEKGELQARELLGILKEFEPRTVIFWCPTCFARFETIFKEIDGSRINFDIKYIAGFLDENINDNVFNTKIEKQVVVYEPCKYVRVGGDKALYSLIGKIPGIKIAGAPDRPEKVHCCGSGIANRYFPGCVQNIKRQCFSNTYSPGAAVVDFCHACHYNFLSLKQGAGVDNFITLLAGAMGIERDDKLKAMSSMKEFKDVINYLNATIHNSPYPYEAGVVSLKAFLNL